MKLCTLLKVRGSVQSSLVLHVCDSRRLNRIHFLTVLSLIKQRARVEKEILSAIYRFNLGTLVESTQNENILFFYRL